MGPVGLECQRSPHRMDHPAMQRDGHPEHLLPEPDLLEGMESPGGDRQVDGATRLHRSRAGVGPPLEQLHPPPRATQQGGHQGPTQPRSHDHEIAHGTRNSSSSACPARQISWKLLYKGTGLSRMMSGARKSPTMPRRRSSLKSSRARSGTWNESWQPRSFGSPGVTWRILP